MDPWSNLEGKVVMVTGASSGLGREICIDLAKAGCKVIAAARRMERLKSLCEEINHFGRATATKALKPGGGGGGGVIYDQVVAVALELDVAACGSTIKSSVEKAWTMFGRIDALVNNAGITGGLKSSLDISKEEWNNVVNTNLRGAWLVSKYVGLCMREAAQVDGCIINISSVVGLNRTQAHGTIAYSSSKAAQHSITKIMALELGKQNIRVNTISPGIFPSEITENLMKEEWIKNVAAKTIPLKTFLKSDPALTSLVRYLLHDSSKYVTGNNFVVDAGFTLPGVPIYSSL